MEINEMVIQAKQGDLAAFEKIYESFVRRIFSYIRQKIQNRQDAEDVLQEVFIKSYKGLQSLRPGKLNFSAWIFKIASNTINDHLRKKYRQPEILSIDDGLDISDGQSLYQAIVAKSDLESTTQKFKFLSQEHRSVLEMRILKQLSVREVSRALNKSSLAVRMLQYRARKRLKGLMEDSSYELAS